MFKYIKEFFENKSNSKEDSEVCVMFSKSLETNIQMFKTEFDNSADLTIKRLKKEKLNAVLITLEGMVNKQVLSTAVTNPVLNADYDGLTAEDMYNYISDSLISSSEQVEVTSFNESYKLLACGFALVMIDNINRAVAVGVQGFSIRSVSDPAVEISQNGSREGFVEAIKINMSLIRRRIHSPKLKFENMKVGVETPTNISICYIRGKATAKMVREVKKRLSSINLPNVLAASYIMPYLAEKNEVSLFSGCYISERPDTVCAKMSEGRICILVDGTPSVICVPYLFVEHFQSMDDYISRPYYATFIRWLKYLSFFAAALLPGLYVATGTFNPELFPEALLNKIAISIASTPFPLVLEALIIHIIYEIVREAGLRLPKTLGHAVSIVGGLVIGDSAVKSGLIGDTTLMILALTAIASYIIPNLYEPIAILRLIFIIVGGIAGIWGIMLVFNILLLNMCSQKSFGIPFMSPITPFSLFGMRDVAIRAGWKTLAKKNNVVSGMPGADSYNIDSQND